MRKDRPGSSKAGTGKFKYRARTADQMNRRANQSGTAREGFVKSDYLVWTPKDGDNKIRILPPTWEDADHFGMEVFAHYQIGPDNSSFLCPKKHHNQDCPICEARLELMNDGQEEMAKELSWKKRVAMWIIDRKDEDKGAQLWFAPWTLDQEIAKQSIDESGEAMPLDSPDEGYDVSFTREKGTKVMPAKYSGVKIARKPSPILDDEDEVKKVLEYITENPVPECLEFHDPEHIDEVFGGGKSNKRKAKDDEDEEEDEKPKKGKASKKDEDEEDESPPWKKGKSKKSTKDEDEDEDDEDEDVSWADVHGMTRKELTKFAEKRGVEFDEDEEFEDLEEAADFVCEALDIEKPKKSKASSKKGKASKKDEDDEDDEDEDDEDEEEEKPKKGKVASKKKASKDEDEDEEDDEADDEDEEEEKPKKKPAAKKKASKEEDEDEDDEEEEEKPKKAWKDKLKKFSK